MLERLPYRPKRIPSQQAKPYIPAFIYHDPSDTSGVEINDEFYGARRKLRIGVLGAGVHAINLLHFLLKTIPEESLEIVVYEKNDDVGGVWLTTKYPGVRSDNACAVYQYSWRPNIWSEYYPPGAEIAKYLQETARESKFYRFMRFRHEIQKASWSDEEAKWTLTIHDAASKKTFDDKVDVFVECNGPVSEPRVNVSGIEAFKGQTVHTAEWTNDIALEGKRVALIGYGSSGVQIAPHIVDKAAKLYTWYRNPTFVVPPPDRELNGIKGANFRYSEEQKRLLKDPDVYLAYRKALDDASDRAFGGMINGTPMSRQAREGVIGYMRAKLASKPEVVDSIIPQDFDVGCRRPTFAYGYLEAIASPKTTVLPKPPQCFTAKGILDAEGVEHELDLIVTATGYDSSHLPRYPKTVNGEDMRARFEALEHPPSYMAVSLDGMPDYFNPSAAYGSLYGSWFLGSEVTARYITKVIDKIQMERVLTFCPKPRAVAHFVRHSTAFMERMVQSGPCAAWYKDRAGRPALWPGSRSHYIKVMQNPRFEDFDFRYENEDDMFSYMANGFVQTVEGDPDADRTWYLGKPSRDVPQEVLEKLRGKNVEPLPPVQTQQSAPKL